MFQSFNGIRWGVLSFHVWGVTDSVELGPSPVVWASDAEVVAPCVVFWDGGVWLQPARNPPRAALTSPRAWRLVTDSMGHCSASQEGNAYAVWLLRRYMSSLHHWPVNGVYAGTLDHVAIEATNGNLTADEWNRSTRDAVGEYLETTTETTRVNGTLIPDSRIVECSKQNIELTDLVTLSTNLPDEALHVLRTVLQEGDVPANADLSFVERLDSVETCTTR